MSLFSTGLLGLIASTASATAPAAAPTQQAQLQHLELTRMQLIDDRCHWLDPTSRVALDATEAERRAWLHEAAPGQGATPADITANAERAKAVSCTSNSDATAIRYGAWQMRVTWALRAYALLDGKDRPAWFAQQSPVRAHRAALEETLAALNEKFGTSIAGSLPGIESEARQMLALHCLAKPQRCESVPGSAHGKDYARVWVQQSARFATALAADPVKLPPIPQ